MARAGHELKLTRTEFSILECLARSAGRVVTRDRLLDTVWGDREVGGNNLEVFIRFLRSKVDRPGHREADTDGTRRRLQPEGRTVIGVGTIRFRLTAAYALILTVMVGGTAVWSWVAARHSVSVTVDRSLERDMALFQSSVQMTQSPAGHRAGDSDVDAPGAFATCWCACSTPTAPWCTSRRAWKTDSARAAGCRTRPDHVSHCVGDQDENVRLAATAIDIQDHRYVAELVQPVTMGERSLARFGRMLMLVIPLALVAGHSRRLLAQRASARAGHADHRPTRAASTPRTCPTGWPCRPRTMSSASCRRP